MKMFQIPFRSFFTLTALCGILVPMYFVGVLVNGYPLSENLISTNLWHANEMIFGFTSALLAGFLLTAAPKWSNKSSVSAAWTIIIVTFWIIARIMFIAQPTSSALYISSSLPLVLIIYKLFTLLRGNKNVFVILTLLTILLISQNTFIYAAITDDYEMVESVYKVVAFVVSSFLIIFSGKLIPFFVNSRLKTKLTQNMKFDLAIVGISLLSTISSLTNLYLLTAILLLTCFVLLSIRLNKLFIKKILSVPLLWILYIGHLWLNIYFLLNLFSLYVDYLNEGRAVIHALFAGALGTFAIGMITRVSLGHSGLEMKSNRLIKVSFISMIIGSLTRVFHPIFLEGIEGTFLHISMGFWTLSFILFLIYFIPRFITNKK